MLTDKQRETLVNSILKEFNLEEQRELGSRYLRNKIEQGVRFGCVELDFQTKKNIKKIRYDYVEHVEGLAISDSQRCGL